MIRESFAGTPDLLALAAAEPQRYPCLLESSASSASHGRYDFLMLHEGAAGVAATPEEGPGFLQELRDQLAAARAVYRDPPDFDGPAFIGGWVLFLAYEMARACEPTLELPRARPGLPTALALRCPAAIAVDRMRGQTWLIAEPGRRDLLERMRESLAQNVPARRPIESRIGLFESPAESFLEAVDAARAYIAAGDVFQVNLSRRWDVNFASAPQPASLHAALRDTNPSPFAALLQYEGSWLTSTSPERLVAVRDGVISTRPIAGTRPRLAGDDDASRRQELLADPKERAEHIMLVDLERNDLGRVCVAGTVEVEEMMSIETYAHVHHIESSVRGRLRQGVDAVDVIRAVFPGGTITGAPKVRCMQIIAELEREGRGAYTGSVGWLGRDGAMDLNILIRTLEGQGCNAHFRAGAGIVADSVPQTELEETRAKAEGLLRALGKGS